MNGHTWFGGGTESKLCAVFPDVLQTKLCKPNTHQTAVKPCGHKYECVGVIGRREFL